MPTDLYWSLDGDFAFSPDGDLRDTSFDVLRSTWQEMRTRCRSAFRDWAIHPSLGANLDELLGRPNNKITAEDGKARIIASLTQGGFLPREVIRVRYIPISRHRLFYDISVSITDQAAGGSRMLKVQMLYDTSEMSLNVI